MELTKESRPLTSDHPPLSPHSGLAAQHPPLVAGRVTAPAHLLPPLHPTALIVFLFIYFPIDFCVEADVALIHSDWLSRCDGCNKGSEQTQSETRLTRVYVCAYECECSKLFGVCECVYI